jgi:hypothetical protein
MIKFLAGIALVLVLVPCAWILHRRHVQSRQRSLNTYNSITTYHAKVIEAAALGQRFIPEHRPDEDLVVGDAGYDHLEAMLYAAQELSLREASGSYEACDMLARHDLNLPFDPNHNYKMTMEMAKLFCRPARR